MAGSDDGAVRIWKNYCNILGRDPTLLTAWQALADVQPAPKGSMGENLLSLVKSATNNKYSNVYFFVMN